jgi:hypothetical protein
MIAQFECGTYSNPQIYNTIRSDETIPDVCALWSFGFRKIADESVQKQGLAQCEHNKNDPWNYRREQFPFESVRSIKQQPVFASSSSYEVECQQGSPNDSMIERDLQLSHFLENLACKLQADK